jgi:hypothetical protein
MPKFVVASHNRVDKVPDDDPLSALPEEPPQEVKDDIEQGGPDWFYEDRDGTGKDFYPARPEPAVAKANILDVLETEWGLSLDEISRLRNKYALLFDFIEAENFQRAEGMIELIARKERWNNNEKQDILDAIT